MNYFLCLLILLAASTPTLASGTAATMPKVHVERVPDDGIQPRLATDGDGRTHLVYFSLVPGETRLGHYYYRFRDGAVNWSSATQLSKRAIRHGDAISKPAIAIDNNSRVHVVWVNTDPGVLGAYQYAHLDKGRWSNPTGIVTEHIEGIEAEASVSARNDTVTITWHAGDMADEATRRVYAITSNDNGLTFGEEIAISDPALGACACCSLATEYDDRGTFTLAFRSAINGDGRHMQVMQGGKFAPVSEWVIDSCPVTSNALSHDWLVFETRGEILEWHHELQPDARVISAESAERQKHPSIAMDQSGNRLVAWSEANGYIKGGDLSLRLVDASGTPINFELIGEVGRPIADFSVASATVLADDSFLVLF